MGLPAAFSSGKYDMLSELKGSIESYYYSFDTAKLEELLERAENLYDSAAAGWHAEYYASVLHIQLGKIYYNDDPDFALEHFEKAAELLKDIDEDTENCEIKTLLSNAYGKISSLSGITAFIHGITAKEYIYEAYELNRENPKFMLIAATHLMHTPAAFGGDKDKAEKLLKRALQKNGEFKEKDDLMLNWAEDAEIYAYLAQLEILRENEKKARKYMDKALELVPEYGFVLIDLQSQLDSLVD